MGSLHPPKKKKKKEDFGTTEEMRQKSMCSSATNQESNTVVGRKIPHLQLPFQALLAQRLTKDVMTSLYMTAPSRICTSLG